MSTTPSTPPRARTASASFRASATRFAARGASLNEAIGALNPLFANLKPVSTALADPDHPARPLLPGAGRRRTDRRAGRGRQRRAVHATARSPSGRSPPTRRRCGTRSPAGRRSSSRASARSRSSGPFLADFAEFSRLLRPGVRDLRAALPELNQTVLLGSKVLPRTVQMNTDLKDVMSNLNDLVADPSTLTSFNRLGDTFNTVQDAGQKIVPAQTVCNYWNYWVTYLDQPLRAADPIRLRGAGDPPVDRRLDVAEHAATKPDGQLLRRPGRRPLLEQSAGRVQRGPVQPAERPPARATASRSSTATHTDRQSRTASRTAKPGRRATRWARH